MKKDVFNGKIKKEYFSYILGCMIFFMLLFAVGGALCIYAFALEGSFNVSGERLLLAMFGVVAFVLGGGYVFPQLFLIRNFPKYTKLRRIFFNSDVYFTDSTSNEYFGGTRTLRGRRNKAAFDLVTSFASIEKGMGYKKTIKYNLYIFLATLMAVLGLVILFVMPLLFENGDILSNISDDVFVLCYLSSCIVCIAFAIFFFARAYKAALIATQKNNNWGYELYTALVDISIRKSSKKHKFWYDTDQFPKIEAMVSAASENARLSVEKRGDKLVSFTVVDSLNDCIVFNGDFR